MYLIFMMVTYMMKKSYNMWRVADYYVFHHSVLVNTVAPHLKRRLVLELDDSEPEIEPQELLRYALNSQDSSLMDLSYMADTYPLLLSHQSRNHLMLLAYSNQILTSFPVEFIAQAKNIKQLLTSVREFINTFYLQGIRLVYKKPSITTYIIFFTEWSSAE